MQAARALDRQSESVAAAKPSAYAVSCPCRTPTMPKMQVMPLLSDRKGPLWAI